jgi:Serine hydrolase
MSDIFLIHGHGYKSVLNFKFKQIPLNNSFKPFWKDIALGKVYMYEWGIQKQPTLEQTINPLFYLERYKTENKLIKTHVFQNDLNQKLLENQPKIIICHSMGCKVLLEYLENFELTHSVQKIIFMNADTSPKLTTKQNLVIKNLIQKNIKIENCFCPWDETLWVSSLANFEIRAGLFGYQKINKETAIQNIFKPLNYSPVLHTPFHNSTINSPKFYTEILSLF